ncbi:DeoR/GlpR family DNA-binding transcription regulator [Miniphocaeibacter halophilus]|uniref:DeoR/GlpR transcriptional regulator n=1 Tax=Miniphocaeibacter halophilus TaxID=2931922 RepID=A0AC61N9R9_9FIRM|nr:DeoR/GlpR family DNA-binding transcription regulator [Miniphocaeibacter halophilus]QQK08408.1 DeoR/GlpR transcriptional regulator [Miniphocaeibacter halophilus]
MIPEERIHQIKNILYEKKNISVKELCKILYCSPSTIRRDLLELEKNGLLRRTHGGATLITNTTTEFSATLRALDNKEAKKRICNLASNFLRDDISIFIDSSSTLYFITEYISSFHNIKVITNGIKIATELRYSDNVEVFLTGGVVKTNSLSIVSEYASTFVKDFNADLCLLSCKCLDNNGYYEADYQQAQIKKNMINNSKLKLMLADSTKFGYNSYINLASHNDIDYLITEKIDPNKSFNYDQLKSKLIYK